MALVIFEKDCKSAIRACEAPWDVVGNGAAMERCKTDDLEEYGLGGVVGMGLGRRCAGIGEKEFAYDD